MGAHTKLRLYVSRSFSSLPLGTRRVRGWSRMPHSTSAWGTRASKISWTGPSVKTSTVPGRRQGRVWAQDVFRTSQSPAPPVASPAVARRRASTSSSSGDGKRTVRPPHPPEPSSFSGARPHPPLAWGPTTGPQTTISSLPPLPAAGIPREWASARNRNRCAAARSWLTSKSHLLIGGLPSANSAVCRRSTPSPGLTRALCRRSWSRTPHGSSRPPRRAPRSCGPRPRYRPGSGDSGPKVDAWAPACSGPAPAPPPPSTWWTLVRGRRIRLGPEERPPTQVRSATYSACPH